MDDTSDATLPTIDSVVGMITDSLSTGNTSVFRAPTGSGRCHIVAEAVKSWKASHPADHAVVIAINSITVPQWNSLGLQAIGRMKAKIEASKKGTVLGYSTDSLSLIVIEEIDHGRPQDVQAIKDLFPHASFLGMSRART